mmetsp:Transcript_31538/g.63019  ORF Transcript_31538/g.63019 Transcript_31538/m.63019 type:complete len:137 (-) Transcript_31538:216-626(-)
MWCNEARGWPCAWPPSHLKTALEVRDRIARGSTSERDVEKSFIADMRFYNELVLDFDHFYNNLPNSIEAIFYISGRCTDVRPQEWLPGTPVPKCEDYARRVHADLLARWPAQAREIPLVRLDPWAWDQPFSEAGAP